MKTPGFISIRTLNNCSSRWVGRSSRNTMSAKLVKRKKACDPGAYEVVAHCHAATTRCLKGIALAHAVDVGHTKVRCRLILTLNSTICPPCCLRGCVPLRVRITIAATIHGSDVALFRHRVYTGRKRSRLERGKMKSGQCSMRKVRSKMCGRCWAMCDYGAIFSYHDLASRAETFDLSLSLSDQLRDDAGQDTGRALERSRRTSVTKIGSRRKPDKGHIKGIILRLRERAQ